MQALYLVAVQAIYNFVLRPRGTQTLLSFVTHFLQVNLELQSMMSELVSQKNYSACSECKYRLSLKSFQLCKRGTSPIQVVNFSLSRCHMYTWFPSAIWLIPPEPEPGAGIWQISRRCYTRLFPPHFWGENLGTRLAAIQMKDVPPLTTYVLPL